MTENHIDQLYKFTQQHFVEYYDVQSELVDHLANDIEEIWIEKPELTFEQARDVSFQKFGSHGFIEVVKEKQKQMNKRYIKILWKFVKEWFTIPKVLITATIFMFFFLFLQLKESGIILMIAVFALLTFEMVCGIIIRYKIRIKKKRKEKMFLLEEMIHKTKNGFILVTIVNVFNFVNILKTDFSSMAIYWLLLISFLLTLLSLLFYITEFIMPQKAEHLLKETYPEYKLSQNM